MRIAAACLAFLLLPVSAPAARYVLIVEGLPGDAAYETRFDEQVRDLVAAAETLADGDRIDVLRTADATREAVLAAMSALRDAVSADDQLAVFLVGHGSYDDHEYKFNIAGPDITGEDLLTALDGIPAATQLVVNTSSASGATADLLAAGNRILVLATRSGAERHATRFGDYFASALADAGADTDKNGQVTVREAFDFAERRVDDFFERSGQLATEHPRLEGELADRLVLARLQPQRPAVADSELAELVAERDAIAADLDALRLQRNDLDPDEYRSRLLPMMLELARIEDEIEAREEELESHD